MDSAPVHMHGGTWLLRSRAQCASLPATLSGLLAPETLMEASPAARVQYGAQKSEQGNSGAVDERADVWSTKQ